ncbi:hypothetical protein NUSPORA_01972 [Nucleospora cyclopteri]
MFTSMENSYSAELGDNELYDFLINAPKKFRENERIKKFQMKNGDFIHCVLWNFHFYISGTDIVKILIYRFQMEGKPINNLKKFEEGIFSDLRNLKPGIDATLEGPRSDFLEFLYKNGCIRTQKKQKVFYWYSVPHDALFCDAIERDLRRETYYATNKPYSPGIFNNTNKTSRNIVKQAKKPADLRNSLFCNNEIFHVIPERKSKNSDLLNKTLFYQDEQMPNIIKRPSEKKSSILDEIVNYNKRVIQGNRYFNDNSSKMTDQYPIRNMETLSVEESRINMESGDKDTLLFAQQKNNNISKVAASLFNKEKECITFESQSKSDLCDKLRYFNDIDISLQRSKLSQCEQKKEELNDLLEITGKVQLISEKPQNNTDKLSN